MTFNSPLFLFAFLPVCFFAYRLVKNEKLKNVFLCAASLLFYSFGKIKYLPLLILSITVNYFIGRSFKVKRNKTLLILALAFNISLLSIFKFLPETGITSLALPLGISFYTFQAMSYVIDAYRDPEFSEDDFIKVFLYISFFPRLLAGPIEKYRDIASQLALRETNEDKSAEGIERFIFGFAKKMLIAVPCSKIANAAFSNQVQDALFAWTGAVAYMLEIYYDFSGYSDMAIGIGKMFGFDFHENFNFPYAAVSIKDFWRRWHISLSSWFKEYVYIPLGGNRKGRLRAALNRVIVFILTGIWHGANITYLVWGLGHGILASLEDRVIPVKKMEKSFVLRTAGRVYTLLAVCLLFVIFRSETLLSSFRYIASMFSFSTAADSGLRSLMSPSVIVSMAAGIIFSFKSFKMGRSAKRAVTVLLFVFCIMAMAKGDFTPFIYMQF